MMKFHSKVDVLDTWKELALTNTWTLEVCHARLRSQTVH